MGYTTKFSGALKLSRALTIHEAKELLEIHEADGEDSRGPKIAEREDSGLRLQWVPTESLDGIVWDGEEKFYSYVECMQWLCAWLNFRDIMASGELNWSGEDAGDTGLIAVVANTVEVIKRDKQAARSGKPLTLAKLGEMALAQLTSASA